MHRTAPHPRAVFEPVGYLKLPFFANVRMGCKLAFCTPRLAQVPSTKTVLIACRCQCDATNRRVFLALASWAHRLADSFPRFGVLMILNGLLGPLVPKNLATVLTWLHFRRGLALSILTAGKFFCLVEKARKYAKAASRSERSKTNRNLVVDLRNSSPAILYNVGHSAPSSSLVLCGN